VIVGTILNAAAIVAGGVTGLIMSRQISTQNQSVMKVFLGAFTVYAGLSMTWQGLNGSFGQVLKQIGIVLLALMLGNVTGKLLRLQKLLNHAGRFARERMNATVSAEERRGFNDGFLVCSILFCAAPLAILGSLTDGLTGNFQPLLIKSIMDGLAMMAFVTMFGWSALLSVVPVVAFQGTLTLLGQSLLPFLVRHGLVDSFNATGGLLVFTVSLIILELRRVELADYFPSLIYAGLLTWWWR